MNPSARSHGFLIGAGLILLLLVACGGGGGDSLPPPLPPPSPEPASYTLSGVVYPASGTAVDGDVNDPDAPYRANNSSLDAQPVPNPVTLGGYVNRPGQGAPGRSHSSGDEMDVFQVSLLQGQSLNLVIASDGSVNDVDLALYDLEARLVDASVGLSRLESLTVPASGTYLVVVYAASGASNYVLTIGQPLTATGEGPRLSDSFMSHEAVVLFRPTVKNPQGLRARVQALGGMAHRQGESEERNVLIRKSDLPHLQSLAPSSDCIPPLLLPESTAVSLDAEIEAKWATLCFIKHLGRDPDVQQVTPNYLRQPAFVPNDPFYPTQWHYPQINLPQAWDITSGTDQIVAVVDTGIVFSHPDLQGQLVPGYDFIQDPRNALDGDGIDPDPTDAGDKSNPDGSSSFHGTHVAGTVVAATHNRLGVAGVAFGAKVMPLRAVGRFGGTLYDIEQAVRYAAGLPNDSGQVPHRRADVINLSLGSYNRSPSEEATLAQVRAAGVLVVAAAGNSHSATPFYPAAYPGVIAVSAGTLNKTLAPYSNFGPWIDLAAPGGNTATDLNGDGKPDGILSTIASDLQGQWGNDYVIWQGTSMAAPHVAGVAALMKAAAPGLTPDQFERLLSNGMLTEDLGATGRDDRFGYGLLNAYKAVTAAVQNAGQLLPPAPILTINPTALNFGAVLTGLTLTVLNGGSGTLTVNPPTEDSGGWLHVTPTQVNASGVGTYTATVNRLGLADGVYHATITFTSNANTLRIGVIMQVANQALSAGAVGKQYVLLISPETGETVSEAETVAQADGSYTYAFHQIPAGTYEIFAGSDANNNQYICDKGESCGAYLTTDAPVRITVDRHQSGLEFISSYEVNLTDIQGTSAPGRSLGGWSRRSFRQLGGAP